MSIEEQIQEIKDIGNNLHEKVDALEKLIMCMTDIRIIVALNDIDITIKYIRSRANSEAFDYESHPLTIRGDLEAISYTDRRAGIKPKRNPLNRIVFKIANELVIAGMDIRIEE